MEAAADGPRCTAIQQERTKADRMICDDGREMTGQRGRNDRWGKRRDRNTAAIVVLGIFYVKLSVISRGQGAMVTEKNRGTNLEPL